MLTCGHFRYVIALLICLCNFAVYICRINLSIAIVYMSMPKPVVIQLEDPLTGSDVCFVHHQNVVHFQFKNASIISNKVEKGK